MADEVTLSQAKQIIMSMGTKQSILMLASPGVGKSAIVEQIAESLGYECRSLLGTQIAPEDISGIPRIEGEGANQRSVFYPPKILLPTDNKPFVLFLDELPICNQEVQKAMYSLLLDRRIGEWKLHPKTIVVSAGNNIEDHAMVRAMSTALVNRVIILHVKVDVEEWLEWGRQLKEDNKPRVREDIRTFIAANNFCLQYKDKEGSKVPESANTPFSTPRSWTALSEAMDLLEDFRKNPTECLKGIYGKAPKKGSLGHDAQCEDGLREADLKVLAKGTISPRDADAFYLFKKYDLRDIEPPEYYIEHPEQIPASTGEDTKADAYTRSIVARATVFRSIKQAFLDPKSKSYRAIQELGPDIIDNFFAQLPKETRVILTEGIVAVLERFGAKKTIQSLRLGQ